MKPREPAIHNHPMGRIRAPIQPLAAEFSVSVVPPLLTACASAHMAEARLGKAWRAWQVFAYGC